ncbi:MAG: hypothetical protein M1820_003285 [Bogoriella megaspora]|nr:MAG: hypothetical protein M1820_003285 [Bogoriella megaspora]
MLLFLIFFPRSTSTTSATSSPPATKKDAVPAFRDALIVVVSSIIFIIAVFIISVFILANYQSHAQSLANVMGIMSAILASIQYLPQLYTTWKLQTVLSLSIPMMCIQTPGSFVWAASLAARVGWEGWSAWAVYVFTGMLQGILLGMGIAFELRDYRKRREDQTNGVAANGTVAVENEGGEDADQQNLGRNDETTPLLRTSSRG